MPPSECLENADPDNLFMKSTCILSNIQLDHGGRIILCHAERFLNDGENFFGPCQPAQADMCR